LRFAREFRRADGLFSGSHSTLPSTACSSRIQMSNIAGLNL
jgi:hypothetical protein